MPFLDVNALLERSQPQARGSFLWYGVGLFLLIVLISVWSDTLAPAAASVVRVLSGVLMFGAVIVMAVYTQMTVRRHRAEQVQLEAIEELVTLRRWPQAAVVLESMLSQPTRTQPPIASPETPCIAAEQVRAAAGSGVLLTANVGSMLPRAS